MRKSIVITDVTRMQAGRVCIAGYDQQGQCVRPVLPPPGIPETSLYAGPSPIIFPSAKVEFDFIQPTPQPPHTEDVRYTPASVRFIERQLDERWHKMLTQTLSKSIQTVFEQPILTDPGHYVMDGKGPRSLGTIKPHRILKAIHEQAPDGKWKYRLGFVDGEQHTYWLNITDLTWRYRCDQRRSAGELPANIATDLTRTLQAVEVYLRVGLARGWDKFPERCYLQLTGVYTFPDLYEGRTFADFAPPHK